ncbi:hypothetical protein [Adhaeribacter radiodurans]|uniref:Uncharacterized protein n=1 Tax=Adhaeribacter radiodurans TaxID=2745197 RepID=A0A7L7L6Z1_9BACT|nr:hypothetical protein [Adhaeribacter radiodurans]QMU28568.1 hypothetical protein HUW48_11190 [Adhaeribacter radiodurans]
MLNRQLIDSLLFVITVFATLSYCYFIFRKKKVYFSKGYTFSLVFLTLYTLLNMCAHLIAVIVVACMKAKAGTFEYDLRLYTLIQFGVLIVIINYYVLTKLTQVFQGNWNDHYGIYKAGFLQILITLPLVPFNPISLLPSLTSVPLMLLVYRASRRYSLNVKSETRTTSPELILNPLVS